MKVLDNNFNPNAGKGRQDKLKFYWFLIINVQVVFRIMLIISILFLLVSNAVTLRRDKSVLYSRSSFAFLWLCIVISFNSFHVNFLDKGIGIFTGLLHTSSITHIFHLFIFIIVSLILLLTSFYPRKIWTEEYSSPHKILYYKMKYFNNYILNKMSEQYRIIEYSLIILFVVLGGAFLMSSSDLISLFLCIELQSYGLYILCVVYRDSERATSGGLTYFLLGGLSSCFILLASGLLYGNSGNTSFDSLYIVNNIPSMNENIIENIYVTSDTFYESYYINFSLVIMSVGLLFKISAAPFHFWSPDVYDAIPTLVTTFVAVFAKISILVLLLELVHYSSNLYSSEIKTDALYSNYLNFSWTFTLLVSSLLSLIIGAVLGLSQFRVKRLYAYSTISHIGFILLALAVNSIESTQSFIFYLIQYSITNLNAFIILIAIGYSLYLYVENEKGKTHKKDESNFDDMKGDKGSVNEDNKIGEENKDQESIILSESISDKDNSPIQLIGQMKGYFYINPILALSLSITLFSFIGVPPLIGFFAKQMILSSALDNGYVFMAFIAILSSVISAYYYLVLVKEIFFNKSEYKLNPELENLNLNVGIVKRSEDSDFKNIRVNHNNIQLSSSLTVTVSILTLIMLLFIINPQESLNMVTILTLALFNN